MALITTDCSTTRRRSGAGMRKGAGSFSGNPAWNNLDQRRFRMWRTLDWGPDSLRLRGRNRRREVTSAISRSRRLAERVLSVIGATSGGVSKKQDLTPSVCDPISVTPSVCISVLTPSVCSDPISVFVCRPRDASCGFMVVRAAVVSGRERTVARFALCWCQWLRSPCPTRRWFGPSAFGVRPHSLFVSRREDLWERILLRNLRGVI